MVPNFPLWSQSSVNHSRTNESASGVDLQRLENRSTLSYQLRDVQHNRAECNPRYNNSTLVNAPDLYNSQSNFSQISRNRTSSATNTCNTCELQTLDASFDFKSQPGIQYHRNATPNSLSSTWVVLANGPTRQANNMACLNEHCEKTEGQIPFPLSSSIWRFDRSEMPSSLGSSNNLSNGKDKPTDSSDDVQSKENIPSTSIRKAETRELNDENLAVADRLTSENISIATDDCKAEKMSGIDKEEALSPLPMFQGHLGSFLKMKKAAPLLSSGSEDNQSHEDISIVKESSVSGFMDCNSIPSVPETADSFLGVKNACVTSSSSAIQSEDPMLANAARSCCNTLQKEAKMGIETNLQDGKKKREYCIQCILVLLRLHQILLEIKRTNCGLITAITC